MLEWKNIQESRRYLLWGHLKSCSDAKPTQYVSQTRFKMSKKTKNSWDIHWEIKLSRTYRSHLGCADWSKHRQYLFQYWYWYQINASVVLAILQLQCFLERWVVANLPVFYQRIDMSEHHYFYILLFLLPCSALLLCRHLNQQCTEQQSGIHALLTTDVIIDLGREEAKCSLERFVLFYKEAYKLFL